MKSLAFIGLFLGYSICSFGQADLKVADSKTSGAQITFDATEYNFGKAKQGDIVNHEFVFTNTGEEPLVISSAAGSCGCTVPVWPKEPIMKGQKGTIKVSFNTAGKLNMQDKTVTIRSNATPDPTVLHVKGTVVSKEEFENQMPFKKESEMAPVEKSNK